MTLVVNSLLSFLLLYKYVAIFVIIYVSGLILPFPTSTVLLAAGAFASQGYFNFWISLSVAIIANMLGDITGYLLARKYGLAILRVLHIRIPASFDYWEDKMRRHAGLTIVVTRFSGSLDVVANFLSGFIGVPVIAFILYDLIGNAISITPILYGGYLAGSYWQEFSGLVDTIGAIVLVGILIVLGILFFVWRGRANRDTIIK